MPKKSIKGQRVSILSPLAAALVVGMKNFYEQAPDQTTRPKSLQITGLKCTSMEQLMNLLFCNTTANKANNFNFSF